MDKKTYEWPNREIEEACRLPSRYYYDPEIMEAEQKSIFYRSWRLAAHISEVAKPRQLVTCEIFDQSTLVARGDDNSYYVPEPEETAITWAGRQWMNTQLGPEDVDLNLSVQLGLQSFGFDQGRYMIDPERSCESEHAVHYFHTRVYAALDS